MDNLECCHLAHVGKNVDTADVDSSDLQPFSTTCEQTIEKSAKVCASRVESDNTTVISGVNLEVLVEGDTQKAVQCDSPESQRVCSSALAENESLSNATGRSESSGNIAVSCEVVGELKIHISSPFILLSREISLQDAEDLKLSSNYSSAVDVMSAPVSAATSVEELTLSRNVAAEIKDGASEMVLPLHSDCGMTSTNSAAATADVAEFPSILTNDPRQIQHTFGTDIEGLLVMRSDAELPPLRERDNVVVLYDIEDHKDRPGKVPDPSPCSRTKCHRSTLDRDCVRMPYATTSNWEQITTVLEQLSNPIQYWNAIEDAIKQYHDYPETLDFSGLEEYFHEKDASCDALLSRTCLLDLIPKIARLAVDLPNVCTRPIKLLRRQENSMVAMSQYQAACLLANAFFCTYPPTDCYSANFMGLFRQSADGRRGSQHAKLDCIFNYFRRVMTNMPTGIITFRRQVGMSTREFSHSF